MGFPNTREKSIQHVDIYHVVDNVDNAAASFNHPKSSSSAVNLLNEDPSLWPLCSAS
jgi:hypothetical protein